RSGFSSAAANARLCNVANVAALAAPATPTFRNSRRNIVPPFRTIFGLVSARFGRDYTLAHTTPHNRRNFRPVSELHIVTMQTLRIPTAVCFFSVLIASNCAAESTKADQPKRPNFVFMYADDWRWDCLGVEQKERGDKGRFPWLETPRSDKLANEGIRFRN